MKLNEDWKTFFLQKQLGETALNVNLIERESK